MASNFCENRLVADFPERERVGYQYCKKDKQADNKLKYLFESF